MKPLLSGLALALSLACAPALADDAWLYVESAADRPAAPAGDWRLHRELRTREAHCALYRRGA